MDALSEYLSAQLAPLLAKRGVVLFYDPRSEFAPFIDGELDHVGGAGDGLVNVLVGEQLTVLARFAGSFFGLRAAVEPVASRDEPGALLVYIPGVERDRHGSVLMELEKGGECYEPQLKRHARIVLRQFYTDGDIDAMLATDALAYEDVVGFLAQANDGGDASILRTLFGSASSEVLLAQWIASAERDATIVEKGATSELYRLVEARVGLALPADTALSDARGKLCRYLLVNEFRADLAGEPPQSVSMVPAPPLKDHEPRIKDVIHVLRGAYPGEYAELADRVQGDLNLAAAGIDGEALGATDTFRFEEARLLTMAIERIVSEDYAGALDVTTGRQTSFWLERDVGRQAQWEACRLAAALGMETARVSASLNATTPASSTAWVEAYCADGGWFEADRLQRRLEAWVAQMDDEPDAQQAIAVVRHRQDELLKRMAAGFSDALVASGWAVADIPQQAGTYAHVERAGVTRVAYILVDAMRFEMGIELAEQLPGTDDMNITPAIAALPTITPIGMAALLPDASGSFSVVEHKGKLAARIDQTVMPDLATRLRFFKSRVPDLLDMPLGKVLQTSAQALPGVLGASKVILVRSQEIDLAGEADGDFMARQVMDTSIVNIARAVRKLAAAGVEAFVITADHGHQFSLRKEEDMRTASPGGDTVDLHRRCWAGRGGTTPPGTVRVSGAELGYETDLAFVFPTGLGVFKAGGGLTYHHGGISLQELVVPLLTFRVPSQATPEASGGSVDLLDVPDAVTNRTFGAKISVVGDVLTTSTLALRVVLLAGEQQVGQIGMAVGAELDHSTGVLTVQPGTEASIGVMLTIEDCEAVRLVVQDAGTDAVLAESKQLPVRLAI